MTTIPLRDIIIDPQVQLQTRYVDQDTVTGYVEALSNETKFPPVVVFQENGQLWLGDGFHRVSAYRFLGLAEIEAEVRPGTRQDAMVFAATANVTNGRPMSQAEKREAGERLLKLTDWSQHEIARRLAIHQTTVTGWAKTLSNEISLDEQPRTVTRNGSTYTMDTSNIGKRDDRSQEPPADTRPLFAPDPDLDAALDDESMPVCPHCGQVYDGPYCPDCARYNPKLDSARPKVLYTPSGLDACQTPGYAIDPLLPYLRGEWTIWEPAAGEGNLVGAFYDAGFTVTESDKITGRDFFEYEPEVWDCLITNPPYSIQFDWLARCYQLGKPFALLLKVDVLGTKTAQKLFDQYGIEVVFLDERISFKMPFKGWDGGGAWFATAWFTWGLNIDRQMTFAGVKSGGRNELAD